MSDPTTDGAICPQCKRNMLRTRTCSARIILLHGQNYDLIPYGAERFELPSDPEYDRCGDCGVKRGGFHHVNCDMEECPRCHEQLIGCECEGE